LGDDVCWVQRGLRDGAGENIQIFKWNNDRQNGNDTYFNRNVFAATTNEHFKVWQHALCAVIFNNGSQRILSQQPTVQTPRQTAFMLD